MVSEPSVQLRLPAGHPPPGSTGIGSSAKAIRETERRVVADAVNSAADGHGLVLSITGEPGIGKTHLAVEALEMARRRGFRSLRGTSTRYQEDVSFAPLLQALSPLVEPTDAGSAARTSGLTDLVRLFSWLGLPDPDPTQDRAAERSRLFDAVRALMQRAAADRPVAMLVDDLHWADAASLDLLAYLALSLGGARCLFIVTDRGDPGEGVRRFRAALRRADRVVDIRLAQLNPDEAADLVTDRLGGEPPRPLLELLDQRARGIPLYLTSLVASLRTRGRLFQSGGSWVLGADIETGLPLDMVDVIADRLDELDPVELEILTALGVWGVGATADMIGVLVPDDGMLGSRLDRLVSTGLVDEDVGDAVTYYGHHPLVVEAACARLSARERRRQHAAAARHLLDQASASGPMARTIAHHVRLAGPAFDREQALEILTAAAVAGTADHSGHEVLPLAEAAVVLIRNCGRTELLPAALERVAESAALTGDSARAIDAWRDAATAHGANQAAAVSCRYRLAQLQVERGEPDAAARSVDEALADLDHPDLVRERFRLLQLRATFNVRASNWTQLRRDVNDLRDTGGKLGLGWLADFFERYLHAGTGRYLLAPSAQDIMTMTGRVASPTSTEFGALLEPLHRPWILDAINRGDLAEAIRRARVVPEHYSVSPGSVAAAIALEGITEWLAGAWDRALPLTGEALVIAHRHANHRFIALALAVRALVIGHRGELDRAEKYVADARRIFGNGEAHVTSTIATVAAQLALLRGRTASALAVLDRASPVNYFGLSFLNLQATAGAADRVRLDRIASEVALVGGPWSAAITRRINGLCQHDLESLIQAACQLGELGMPYEQALVLLESAELHPTDVGAADPTASALAIFDRLGAAPAGDRARRLLRRLGHRPPPGPRTPGPLTERETQVAELVARGLSNADVAARLFISHRTVTTHLEHIYRRLGISSRAELARLMTTRAEQNT